MKIECLDVLAERRRSTAAKQWMVCEKERGRERRKSGAKIRAERKSKEWIKRVVQGCVHCWS